MEPLKLDTQFDGVPMAAAARSRPNRDTIMTDAPTISTQSPYGSPISDNYHGDGLRPRPPSFPYGQGAAPAPVDEFASRRTRRRESRRQNRHQEAAAQVPPATMPAVPEPPRAPPPMSYRAPLGVEAPVVTPATMAHMDQPEARAFSPTSTQVAEAYYRSEGVLTPGPIADIRVAEEMPIRATNGKPVLHQLGPERTVSAAKRPVVATNTNAEERRQDWASERSPLQNLERRLGTITKEEKRAKIEQAEMMARQGKPDMALENRAILAQRERRARRAREAAEEEAKRMSLKHEQTAGQNNSEQSPQLVPAAHTQTQLPVAVAMDDSGVSRSRSHRLKKRQPEEVLPRSQTTSRRAPPGSIMDPIEPKAGPSRIKQVAPVRGPEMTQVQPTAEDVDLDAVIPKNHPAEPFDPHAPQHSGAIPVAKGSRKKIEQLMGQKIPASQKIPTPSSKPLPPGPTMHQQALREGLLANDTHPVASNPQVNTASPRDQSEHRNYLSMLHRRRSVVDQHHYTAEPRLDEWKQGGVAKLCDDALNLVDGPGSAGEQDAAWWESSTKQRTRPSRSRAEAYVGEYAETDALHIVLADTRLAPTRFKPHLHIECGPLLRYCGMRKERRQGKHSITREIWRGSVMVVTRDSESSYELAPTLRLFLQPMDLLPPPPRQIAGDIDPRYVDPIAGLPKVGRDGETRFVRPIDQIPEGFDLSYDESDEGLYERQKSTHHDHTASKGAGSGVGAPKTTLDGEKCGKFKEVRGHRLYAERDVTFWRFNIEVELRENQQRIAYRINRGPAIGFWVPARHQAMNIMFHSCNGFSHGVNSNKFSGPDPMWRDVLNTHQTQPFHVMLGGGDQIYMDSVMHETVLFKNWLDIRNPSHKEHVPFNVALQDELEGYFLQQYCSWFSQGLFSLANSQIPMVNIWDDHDIIDGFGSYPDSYMASPVMAGLGSVAFKYYMLFQHQSSIDEGEQEEPTWLLGTSPGPYISEMSRSIFTFLGRSVAFLGLDCRTERTNEDILTDDMYEKAVARLKRDIIKGETKHLIVMLGVPIAYPRMVWLENILTSRLMAPVKALGRAGLLGKKTMNRFDGGVEVLDDLDDHWTAKHHKEERNEFIRDLQAIAEEKSVRVTILGGDVHLAAIGQFYSNPKLNLPKDEDPRYMPNVISSAIVNTPPPDMLADVLNKRNKVHHFDTETDEDMIPIFTHDVDGSPRNNKCLLNRRNWCSIREFDPALASPPPTPSPPGSDVDDYDYAAETRPAMPRRSTTTQSKPPLTSARGFFSRGRDNAQDPRRTSSDSHRPPSKLRRTLSLTREGFMPGLMRSFSQSRGRQASAGDVGVYSPEHSEDEDYNDTPPARRPSIKRLFRSFSKRGRTRKTDSGGINGYASETDSEAETSAYAHDAYEDEQDSPEELDAEPLHPPTPPPKPRTRHHRPSGIRGGSGGPEVLYGTLPPYGATVPQGKLSKYYPSNSRRVPPSHQYMTPAVPQRAQQGHEETDEDDDDDHGRPRIAAANPVEEATTSIAGGNPVDGGLLAARPSTRPRMGSFKRRPTDPLPATTKRGLAAGKARRPRHPRAREIDLEGGLDICLNVEVNPLDPSGITMPYRLLVPALRYAGAGAGVLVGEAEDARGGGGSKTAVGLGRKMSLFGRR